MSPRPKKTTKTDQPYLPRYEVIEPLGEGAMASVYKVRATRDGAVRALKALKPEQLKSPRTIERFEDEFRILRELHHPSVPEVYDYGFSADGGRYMVMELVDGEPLDDYFKSYKEELWLLVYELVEAIAFIHEHDLLHLDLKPTNVLVRRTRAFGEAEMPLVTLIDFGMSYQREKGGKVTLSGTPGYVSPEVIRVEDRITRAADYYSLGVILYELVEGRLPFGGNRHDMLQAHLIKEPKFGYRKMEYAELYPWIEKLLAKDVNTRLETFGDFRRAVSDRLVEKNEMLERAYALGAVESLGLVGKEEVWRELLDFVERFSRPAETPKPKRSKAAPPIADVSDVEDPMQRELLEAGARHAADVAPGDDDIPKTILLFGPRNSGKRRLIRAVQSELALRGVPVIRLDETERYEQLIAGKGRARSRADLGAQAVERFREGWEALRRDASDGRVAVVAEDLDALPEERREFLRYVSRRAHLSTKDDARVRVTCVVGSRERDTALATDDDLALIMPPPTGDDIERLVSEFEGGLFGANERQLANYLEGAMSTTGGVIDALRRTASTGELTRQHGYWRFDPASRPEEADAGGRTYYQQIAEELPPKAKTLIAYLVCHPQPLSVGDVVGISGLAESDVLEAVESLRPYRLITVHTSEAGNALGVVSGQIRNAIYETLDEAARKGIHEKLLANLGDRAKTATDWETLSFHHGATSRYRDASTARYRALQAAKDENDLFAIRRICEDGLRYVRGLHAEDSDIDVWPAERYLLKNWIDAEWKASDYRRLAEIVETELVGRGREVPLSFAYKYAAALQRTDQHESCEKVLTKFKSKAPKGSETYNHLLLVEGQAVYNRADYEKVPEVLKEIDESHLGTLALSTLYVLYTLTFENLGRQAQYDNYFAKAVSTASMHGHHEQLMRVRYSHSLSLLAKSQYDEARKEVTDAIRVSSRHRAYRSLCAMYLLASNIYHEEGRYRRSAQSMDKAIRIAADMGMDQLVNDYTLRYAFIHRGLGQFGNAMQSVESVKKRLSSEYDIKQYTFALMIQLDVALKAADRKVPQIVEELDSYADRIQAKYRLAYYHRLRGVYYYKRKRYDDALKECETARDMYRAIEWADDVAKSEIMMAEIHLSSGNRKAAAALVEGIGRDIEPMESVLIHTDYAALRLRFDCEGDGDAARIEASMRLCEDLRSRVSDVSTAMNVDAALFRASARLGNHRNAMTFFDSYFLQAKAVAGNLSSPEQVRDYVGNSELTDLLAEFKEIRKNPSR